MLSDFIHLHPEHPHSKSVVGGKKQWVIQNGGNSAVGVAVIQLAREWGVGTINLVRDRCDLFYSSIDQSTDEARVVTISTT